MSCLSFSSKNGDMLVSQNVGVLIEMNNTQTVRNTASSQYVELLEEIVVIKLD